MIQVKRQEEHGGNGPNRFEAGQLVRHRRYGYRGVVVAFDHRCLASEHWYRSNKSQPGREQCWYHVLVDGGTHTTYAAEENLEPDDSPMEVRHPLIAHFFSAFADGRYVRNDRPWPRSESD